jgi:cytochrome c-type biogenesis protein CcsB
LVVFGISLLEIEEEGKNMFKILIFLISFNLYAQVPTDTFFCSAALENLPTQEGGRVKPLYVLGKETFKYLSGKSKIEGFDTTTAFCLLSFKSHGIINTNLKPLIRVDHNKVKDILGLTHDKINIDADAALEFKDEVRSEIMIQKENNAYKKDLNKVFNRISLYESVISGEAWTFAQIIEGKIQWTALTAFVTEDKISSLKKTSGTPFLALFDKSKQDYIQIKGDNYLTELKYRKLHIFSWAMVVTILAIVLLTTVKSTTPGVVLISLSLLMQLTGLVFRAIISGRAPITNMYETVMFSGFGALILAVILFAVQRKKFYLYAGLGYNLLCLMMLMFANEMLDGSISPLVPVLRDNFWLSTHVTCIILSYAALALSWMLANLILFRQTFKTLSNKELNQDIATIYTSVKCGIVLLAAGIILGGVWADYSWGRFWGWDPKETWSLIVLLVYIAIAHGKYTNWIKNSLFPTLIAAAFMSVMMAWFGVNYILASGLHSYGFSEGGAIFLGSFFMIQIGFLILVNIKLKVTAK